MVCHLLDTGQPGHFRFWLCPVVVNHEEALTSPYASSVHSYFISTTLFSFLSLFLDVNGETMASPVEILILHLVMSSEDLVLYFVSGLCY